MTRTSDWADAAEGRLLSAALPRVATLGWTRGLVSAAAKDIGNAIAAAQHH